MKYVEQTHTNHGSEYFEVALLLFKRSNVKKFPENHIIMSKKMNEKAETGTTYITLIWETPEFKVKFQLLRAELFFETSRKIC